MAFVGSKVGQFLMCEAYDLISDIEVITVSSRQYIDGISISFLPTIENSVMDLPINLIIAITCLENCVAV
jgi:hypothetical protein